MGQICVYLMLSLPPEEFSQGAVKLSYDPCVFLQLCTFHGVQSCVATDQAQITCVKKSRATVTYVLKLSHELKKKVLQSSISQAQSSVLLMKMV